MSKIALEGNSLGTGTFTIAAPNSNSSPTLTLPTSSGTIITTAGGDAISGTTGTFSSTIQGGATISVGGATPSASGAGITFPATQSASTDANTLDDYEEGTWTPTVRGELTAGTTTYTTQLGYYTKIGNTVHLYCSVAYSAATGTGTLQIKGLPFNNVDRVTMGAVRTQDLNTPATSTWIVTAFQDNSGTITFNGSGDDVAVTEVALSNESAGIIFQITYRV